MNKEPKQKLYCYVDESGQDTKGEIFVVSIIVAKEDREEMVNLLKKIELDTRKKKTKWRSSKREYKIAYLEEILTRKLFKHRIFYSLSKETKAYTEITLLSIASAITAAKDQENYQALIFIDGLRKSEIPQVGSRLRKIGVHTEKVRGIKDENDSLIRLADAIAGLIRECTKNIDYAKKLYNLGVANKVLVKV